MAVRSCSITIEGDLSSLLRKVEPLCPELRACITSKPFPMLRHPLVMSVPFSGKQEHAYLNACLKAKQHSVAECVKQKLWYPYLFLHERPFRLQAFMNIMNRLPDKLFWELLGDLWVDCEWPRVDDWKPLFFALKPKRWAIMSVKERRELKALPKTIHVYHGEERKGKIGMSWTTKPSTAVFFAQRYKTAGTTCPVYDGLVAKEKVVAYFSRRGESEVLIDPKEVQDLKVWKVV